MTKDEIWRLCVILHNTCPASRGIEDDLCDRDHEAIDLLADLALEALGLRAENERLLRVRDAAKVVERRMRKLRAALDAQATASEG